MATTYQIINVKESKGNYNGGDYNNVNILCYCSESASAKYLIAGSDTDTLKMKRDDYNYVMRARNYTNADLEDSFISPVFDKNGYLTDFTLSNPESGETK